VQILSYVGARSVEVYVYVTRLVSVPRNDKTFSSLRAAEDFG